MTTEAPSAPTQDTALAQIAAKSGLPATVTEQIVTTFIPFVAEAGELARMAEGVVVTDPTQVTEIKRSRELRLKLKTVRVNVDKSRKAMKEDALRRGQFIDALARHATGLIEPVEKRLEDQEKIAERMEAERKTALRAERSAALAPYGVDPSFYQLGDMPADQWLKLLDTTKTAHEARLAAEKKAQEEREAAERARAEEDRRIREENDRLKREQEEQAAAAKAEKERIEAAARAEQERLAAEIREQEARAAEERRKAEEATKAAAEKARKEREAIQRKADEERRAAEARAAEEKRAAEAVAAQEREARERAEAELKRKQEEEDRRKAAEEKARRAAEAAPDREKILAVAAALRALPLPSVVTPSGKKALRLVENTIATTANAIEEYAEEVRKLA